MSDSGDARNPDHGCLYEVWRLDDGRWKITARPIIGQTDDQVIIDSGSGEQYV